ncbi:MAG: recombination protein RecR [Sphingobacteriales bacterium]|jgi:recombination protein RecR
MNFSSKIFEEAVLAFSKLPGIGERSATRLVLHLLKEKQGEIEKFGETFLKLGTNIKFCQFCHNLTDTDTCGICLSPKRNKEIICVVEDVRDIMAIESTGQYNGLYHVLGGLISPMDGVGPTDLNIQTLIGRSLENSTKEVILALSATMEGDTTIFYISKKLNGKEILLTTIARGISFGGELEYVDEVTLGRSITKRIPYDPS